MAALKSDAWETKQKYWILFVKPHSATTALARSVSYNYIKTFMNLFFKRRQISYTCIGQKFYDNKFYVNHIMLHWSVFTDSAPWARTFIKLQCSSICRCVCPFAMRFVRPIIGPQITWSVARPLIGPNPEQVFPIGRVDRQWVMFWIVPAWSLKNKDLTHGASPHSVPDWPCKEP